MNSPVPGLVSIIIPVHNRREVTLACLENLQALGVTAWAEIVVVDDASSDGTAAAVRERHPAVRIVEGSGDLWWTGAIEAGMRDAAGRGARFLFWLNDDCLPAPGSMETLLDDCRAGQCVAGGVCRDPQGNDVLYSGWTRTRFNMAEIKDVSEGLADCDALNGNLVCFPRAVWEKVGFPDGTGLPHMGGDNDYTLRARRAGFRLVLDGRARATSRVNEGVFCASWLDGDFPMRRQWEGLADRRCAHGWPYFLRFRLRHWGFAGLLYAAFFYLKLAGATVLIAALGRGRLRRWRGRLRGPEPLRS